MNRTPQSLLKASPPSSHFLMSSPPELRPIDRFISPSPSAGRGPSVEPLPPIISLRLQDKMSIAAATHPTPSLLSPPESPETPHVTLRRNSPPTPPRRHDYVGVGRGEILMSDEPLLPEDEATISLETPLFNVNENDEPLIQKAAARRSHQAPPGVRPSVEDYDLFVSSAWRLYQSNPKEWLRREERYNAMYRTATLSSPSSSVGVRKTSMKPAYMPPKRTLASISLAAPQLAGSTSGSTSPNTVIVTPTRPRPIAATPSSHKHHHHSSSSHHDVQRPARAPRATPKMMAMEGYDVHMYTPPRSSSDGTPAPRQRLTAPTREDSNFAALPDLSPPLTSLPAGNNRCLQTDWRGNPLAIENEPYFEMLHPAEARLASTLRLTPAIYLSSKRRIFLEKVRRTQIGKEFRKTDSQKACKIDVNKASKLWTAFDKVGWFDLRFVTPHLDKRIDIEP